MEKGVHFTRYLLYIHIYAVFSFLWWLINLWAVHGVTGMNLRFWTVLGSRQSQGQALWQAFWQLAWQISFVLLQKLRTWSRYSTNSAVKVRYTYSLYVAVRMSVYLSMVFRPVSVTLSRHGSRPTCYGHCGTGPLPSASAVQALTPCKEHTTVLHSKRVDFEYGVLSAAYTG